MTKTEIKRLVIAIGILACSAFGFGSHNTGAIGYILVFFAGIGLSYLAFTTSEENT